MTDSNASALLNKSGIRHVHYYVANGPVETCDRCGQGIRYVSLVTYKDGNSERFGSECINKILAGAPTLRKLFTKHVKWLKENTEALRVLSLAPEDMPRGSEYYGSGMYFVADSKGKDVFGRSGWFFHPVLDWDKNQSGRNYVQKSVEAHQARCLKDIEEGKAFFVKKIAEGEAFLGRILAKVTA